MEGRPMPGATRLLHNNGGQLVHDRFIPHVVCGGFLQDWECRHHPCRTLRSFDWASSHIASSATRNGMAPALTPPVIRSAVPLRSKSAGPRSPAARLSAERAASAAAATAPGSPSRPAYMIAAIASAYVSRAAMSSGLSSCLAALRSCRAVALTCSAPVSPRGCARTPSGREAVRPGPSGRPTIARVPQSQGVRRPPPALPRPVCAVRPRGP